MEQFNTDGIIYTISGVSSLGKSRINEHGKQWKIVKKMSNKFLLESILSGYRRWMDYEDDRDFKLKY